MTVSTLAFGSARPITTTGHRRPAEQRCVHLGHPERDEDQPVREPALELLHDRELFGEVAAGRVQDETPAARADDLLDRRDHRGVDGVRDVGHGERDLPCLPRAERAGGGVRDVADPLGGLDHALVDGGCRADPVERARGRRDRDVRKLRDGGDGGTIFRQAENVY